MKLVCAPPSRSTSSLLSSVERTVGAAHGCFQSHSFVTTMRPMNAFYIQSLSLQNAAETLLPANLGFRSPRRTSQASITAGFHLILGSVVGMKARAALTSCDLQSGPLRTNRFPRAGDPLEELRSARTWTARSTSGSPDWRTFGPGSERAH